MEVSRTKREFYELLEPLRYNKDKAFRRMVNKMASGGDVTCQTFLHENYGIVFVTSVPVEMEKAYSPPPQRDIYDYIKPNVDPRPPVEVKKKKTYKTKIRYTIRELEALIRQDKITKGEEV